MSRTWRVLALVSLALATGTTPCLSAGLDWVGPNLLTNPDFAIANDQGLPVDWTVTATPVGSAKFSLDRQVFLVGKVSLKADVRGHRRGRRALEARPGRGRQVVPGFRRLPHRRLWRAGKYSGVDSYVAVTWNDAAGRQIDSSPGISFPYHPVDWDLGDRFVQAPAGAAQLVLTANLNNHSRQQIGKNIPSTLWLGSCQIRQLQPAAHAGVGLAEGPADRRRRSEHFSRPGLPALQPEHGRRQVELDRQRPPGHLRLGHL